MACMHHGYASVIMNYAIDKIEREDHSYSENGGLAIDDGLVNSDRRFSQRLIYTT